MKLEAKVKVDDDAEALFSVSRTGPGMYQAILTNYQGRPESIPPSRIILLRSFRNWTGSCDNEALLNGIGNEIDRFSADAPIFKNDNRRRSSLSPDQ